MKNNGNGSSTPVTPVTTPLATIGNLNKLIDSNAWAFQFESADCQRLVPVRGARARHTLFDGLGACGLQLQIQKHSFHFLEPAFTLKLINLKLIFLPDANAWVALKAIPAFFVYGCENEIEA